MQSGPGSLVSAFLSISLSPVCGLDVFTTPVPQPIWSTREQRPPRMFTKKVGTTKPGWSQQPCVPRGTQPFGLSATSQPGMPAQDAFGFPHGTHAACSHFGKASAPFTVKVVCTPVGNGMIWPSAVSQGSGMHAPVVPPQSVSLAHAAKRFAAEFVVQRISPVVPWSLYVPAIGCPTTIGAHCDTSPVAGGGHIKVVVDVPLTVVVVVVLVGQASPDGRGLQTSVRVSLSTFLGFALERVMTTILHLPGFVPLFFSFASTPDIGPQLDASPDGEKPSDDVPRHLPLTLTRLSAVPVQAPSARLAQSCRVNVHEPFAVPAPSSSHAGSQSVQAIVPPFLSASGTPENPMRHSVVASMTAWPERPATSVAASATMAARRERASRTCR